MCSRGRFNNPPVGRRDRDDGGRALYISESDTARIGGADRNGSTRNARFITVGPGRAMPGLEESGTMKPDPAGEEPAWADPRDGMIAPPPRQDAWRGPIMSIALHAAILVAAFGPWSVMRPDPAPASAEAIPVEVVIEPPAGPAAAAQVAETEEAAKTADAAQAAEKTAETPLPEPAAQAEEDVQAVQGRGTSAEPDSLPSADAAIDEKTSAEAGAPTVGAAPDAPGRPVQPEVANGEPAKQDVAKQDPANQQSAAVVPSDPEPDAEPLEQASTISPRLPTFATLALPRAAPRWQPESWQPQLWQPEPRPAPASSATPLTGEGLRETYRSRVLAHLSRFRVFPDAARSAGLAGRTVVSLTIDRSGNLRAVSIEGRSGKPVLDQAALDMVRRAAPFPAAPPGSPATFTVLAGITYGFE